MPMVKEKVDQKQNQDQYNFTFKGIQETPTPSHKSHSQENNSSVKYTPVGSMLKNIQKEPLQDITPKHQ